MQYLRVGQLPLVKHPPYGGVDLLTIKKPTVRRGNFLVKAGVQIPPADPVEDDQETHRMVGRTFL